MKYILVLLGAVLLASPALAQTTKAPVKPGAISKSAATANPVLVIQKFTVDDLTAALADANAQTPPDAAAAQCYTALIPVVQSNIANPFPTGLGGFQLLQKARDAKAVVANLQSPTGPLAALNMACAPLVLDVQNTLIQLGILGGAVAVAGPAAGLTLPIALPIPLLGIP